MATGNSKGFITKDNKVVTTDYIDFYIPESFFDPSIRLAEYVGNKVKTMGLIMYTVRPSLEGKPVWKYLNYSNSILLNFTDKQVVTENVPLFDDAKFHKLHIQKGDVWVDTSTLVKDSNNTNEFLRMLHFGKLPRIEYSKLLQLYVSNLDDNGVDLNVSNLVIEVLLAELCRDPDDETRPFRFVADKKGEYEYKLARMKDLAKLSSTFAGLAFENMNESIRASVAQTMSGKEDQNRSPIEDTIKY